MIFKQIQITLGTKSRGFHLVTDEILYAIKDIKECKIGTLHLFIQHTSASLLLSENTDANVLIDLENYFNQQVSEGSNKYLHFQEGPDDMPAHIKNAILGTSLTIPIQNGRLALGTWQGIILAEHRNHPSRRNLLATIMAN